MTYAYPERQSQLRQRLTYVAAWVLLMNAFYHILQRDEQQPSHFRPVPNLRPETPAVPRRLRSDGREPSIHYIPWKREADVLVHT